MNKALRIRGGLVLGGLVLAAGAWANPSDDKFKTMDADGDGMVTATEHAAGARTMFDRMDTNRDGNVTAAEMDTAHAKGGRKAGKPMTSSEKIAAMDSNDDGVLSLSEHEAGARAKFAEADADGSGTLSRQEMNAAQAAKKAARKDATPWVRAWQPARRALASPRRRGRGQRLPGPPGTGSCRRRHRCRTAPSHPLQHRRRPTRNRPRRSHRSAKFRYSPYPSPKRRHRRRRFRTTRNPCNHPRTTPWCRHSRAGEQGPAWTSTAGKNREKRVTGGRKHAEDLRARELAVWRGRYAAGTRAVHPAPNVAAYERLLSLPLRLSPRPSSRVRDSRGGTDLRCVGPSRPARKAWSWSVMRSGPGGGVVRPLSARSAAWRLRPMAMLLLG